MTGTTGERKESAVSRRLAAYGPSLIVLCTVAVVLLAGPVAVRQLTYARTQQTIQQASERLWADNILESINAAHRDIALKVEPSVVYISTEQSTREFAFGGDAPLRLSSGSGWVYDDQGHIVTNEHVIQGAERIQVQLNTGQLRDARVLGTDPRTDIAVLKIAPGQLHPAERAPSDSIEQGDQVFAFGSPFDFRFSMSQGIVSGTGRDAQLRDVRYQNFIQVDAAINPGNSGGPLTDIYGRVIGMNTAIATGRQGSLNDGVFSGIGLAIPMEMIEGVVPQLIEQGEVSRGFIGVELYRELSAGSARALGFASEGVEVKKVNPGGPADEAGLRPGDVITRVDGRPVATLAQIQSTISARTPGETIELDVWRYDREDDIARNLTLDVTLAEMDPSQMLAQPMVIFLQGFGLYGNLSTATEENAARFGTPFQRGVLVEEVPAGSAIDGAIQPGSIITHVAEEPVWNLDAFYARVERFLMSARRTGLLIRVVTPEGEEDSITLRP